MELFRIRCTTCQAKLRVHDPAAVGQIIGCPKCNSMVLVAPPPDWSLPEGAQTSTSRAAIELAESTDSSGRFDSSWRKSSSELAADVPPAEQKQSKRGGKSREPSAASSERDNPKHAAARKQQAAAVRKDAQAEAADEYRPRDEVEPQDATTRAPDIPSPESPIERLTRQATLILVVPAILLVTITIWWTFRTAPGNAEPSASVESAEQADPEEDIPNADDAAPAADQAPQRPPWQFSRRWIVPDAHFIVSVDPATLDQSAMARAWRWAAPTPARTVSRVLSAFQIPASQTLRLSWSQSAPDRQKDAALFVLELAEPIADDHSAIENSEQLGYDVAGVTARRFPNDRWPHPFVLLDPRTLITGPAEVLQQSDMLGAVMLPPEADDRVDILCACIEAVLEASGDATPAALHGKVPERGAPATDWLDDSPLAFWLPLYEAAWQELSTLAVGACSSWHLTTEPALRVRIVCASESAATAATAVWNRALAETAQHLRGQATDLDEALQAGHVSAEAAPQIERVQTAIATMLEAQTIEQADAVLTARFPLPVDAAELAATAEAIAEDWLRLRDIELARSDVGRQQTLIQGLLAAQRAEGRWPSGAAGAGQLPPHTRLSWIASTLPYFEGNETWRQWHGRLNFFRPWNDAANHPVARQPLSLVMNPRLRYGQTSAGFPVTHYVGITGLGEGAGQLPLDDPRAGIFNFRRTVTADSIVDGASQTIALLGASGRLGAWAAGGFATARPLVTEPYVNGPDGFGSGHADGMLAAMVDGSVRWISADADPRVIEQLATINGGAVAPPAIELALLPTENSLALGNTDVPAVDDPGGAEEPEPAADTAGREPQVADEAAEQRDQLVIERLAMPLPAVEIEAAPLSDFVELVAQLTALEITLDLDAILGVGVSADQPVSVQLTETTIAETLSAALDPLGLAYIVQGGHVVVTSPAAGNAQRRQVRYRVDDLVGDAPDALQKLAELVRTLVEPAAWTDAGGEADLDARDSSFIVTANDGVHRELLFFCEKLRVARGVAPRSQFDPRLFDLASRTSQAAEVLLAPVVANFPQPTPLDTIAARLQRESGANILIDGLALADAGLSSATETTLAADQVPLATALNALGAPLDLTYRIVGRRTLELSTPAVTAARMEIELYPVADLLGPQRNADQLVAQVLDSVSPASWQTAGGSGACAIDEASRVLIVRQTQRLQQEVESLLAAWRSDEAHETAPPGDE